MLSSLFLSLVHAPFARDFSLHWALLSDSFAIGASLPPPAPSDADSDDSQASHSNSAPAQPKGERETAERLALLSGLLHGRQFNKFWATLRTGAGVEKGEREDEVRSLLGGLTKSAQGFEDTLRERIAAEVEASFVGLAKPTVNSFLGLPAGSSSELKALAEKRGWTVEGETVKIPKNESNSPASTLQRERIEIDQLEKLLGRSQAV